MSNSKQIFSANLRKLSTSLGMGCDELANALGLRGEEKKWLWRLWEHGLGRAHKNTEQLLLRLANVLGLRSPAELWQPTCTVQPDILLRHNLGAWVELVRQVSSMISAVSTMAALYPKQFGKISQQYTPGDLIVLWAARQYGTVDVDDDLELFDLMLRETKERRKYYEENHILDQVHEMMNQHPRWLHLIDKFGGEYVADFTIDRLIDSIRVEPLTAQELYKRFAERYLDDATAT